MKQSVKYSHIFNNKVHESPINIRGINSKVNFKIPMPEYSSPIMLPLEEYLDFYNYASE